VSDTQRSGEEDEGDTGGKVEQDRRGRLVWPGGRTFAL
jgi:hypothetical protein